MSYAEPVLEAPAAASQHPAFSRLFVECEAFRSFTAFSRLDDQRDPEEASAAAIHYAVWESSDVSFVGSQIDRAAVPRART